MGRVPGRKFPLNSNVTRMGLQQEPSPAESSSVAPNTPPTNIRQTNTRQNNTRQTNKRASGIPPPNQATLSTCPSSSHSPNQSSSSSRSKIP